MDGISCVARTGFEPVISALRGQRPEPLDERAKLQTEIYAKPLNPQNFTLLFPTPFGN